MAVAVEPYEQLPFPTPPPRLSGPVPDLVGALDIDDARLRAQLGGFTIRIEETADDAPAGTIVSQSPAAGAPFELGRMVVVFISTGENGSLFLPNLVGVTQDVAVARLAALGHPWQLNGRAVDDPSQNLIVQTMQPAAGSIVVPGSVVIILEIGLYEGGGG
jgi:beta-lactam-binding protein with PASTA domain